MMFFAILYRNSQAREFEIRNGNTNILELEKLALKLSWASKSRRIDRLTDRKNNDCN